jgi:hypothetical protein
MGAETKEKPDQIYVSEKDLNLRIEEYDTLVRRHNIHSYQWMLFALLELKQLRAEKRYRERKIDPNLK